MVVQSTFTGKWELKRRGRLVSRNNIIVRGNPMRKFLSVLIAVAALGVAAVATSGTAEARWGYGWHGGWGWRGGWGWGPGPWIAGAAVGAAIAAPYYYGGYGPYYPYGPGYGYGCRRAWNGYYWVRACY
jgi:hypothetical protein